MVLEFQEYFKIYINQSPQKITANPESRPGSMNRKFPTSALPILFRFVPYKKLPHRQPNQTKYLSKINQTERSQKGGLLVHTYNS